MRDQFDFVIMGGVYQPAGIILQHALKEGDPLFLEREPDNSHDSDAIKVLDRNKRHLGYISNRGTSCTNCWGVVSPGHQVCQECGADWDSFLNKGLATRLIHLGVLESNYRVLVNSVDRDNHSVPVSAIIFLRNPIEGTQQEQQ